MAYTSRRLTKAYYDAKIKYFDENSKIIFFSDSHRGDDSISDEFTRNQTLMLGALRYYYREGFTYIENGDGDDLWEYPHFKHIRVAHTDIFTIMKKFYDAGRYIMIYGNHNIYMRNKLYVKAHYDYFYDEYQERNVELFKGIKPIESLILKQKKTGQEILVLHGHQGDLMNDQLWFVNMFILRYFWRFMHVVGFHNPASPAKNQAKRHKVERHYTKWIAKYRTMLICGHTHRMKYPRQGELPYFNSGCCIHTKGISGIEIQNNQIMLVQWRVETDKDGILRIRRHVIRGPEPVEKFDMRK